LTENRLPPWLRKPLDLAAVRRIKKKLRRHHLHTVCEAAKCPNMTECFHKGTATFMIMGDRCTRNCRFCAVPHGPPTALDPDEPAHLAHMVAELGLRLVVITSVTRDDLPDGGAGHFCRVIRTVRGLNRQVIIEVLVPDFQGDRQAAEQVIRFKPDIFNHNLETVPRLYAEVRPQASVARSVALLRQARDGLSAGFVKTGLMVGVGETREEIADLVRQVSPFVDILTIGQYMAPSRRHLPVTRYYTPREFGDLRRMALEAGIAHVYSGPFVRSSYNAQELFTEITHKVGGGYDSR